MQRDYTNKNGFTIVELLIVITIVGILAAFAIISYQAYAKNARNKQTAAITQAYIDALNLYRLEKNKYPNGADLPDGYACLGEGYDLLNDGSKTCLVQTSWVAQVKESSAFNAVLKPYFPGQNLPKASDVKLFINSTNQFMGGVFMGEDTSNDVTVDGVPHPWLIAYYQEGATTKCPIGPVLTLQNLTGPDFTTDVPSAGYTMSMGGIMTACVIKLPAVTATT